MAQDSTINNYENGLNSFKSDMASINSSLFSEDVFYGKASSHILDLYDSKISVGIDNLVNKLENLDLAISYAYEIEALEEEKNAIIEERDTAYQNFVNRIIDFFNPNGYNKRISDKEEEISSYNAKIEACLSGDE